MEKVLTMAGSDSSGGAGIQADLKTFQELGVYGMSALTVIVTMDPHNHWNHGVFPIDVNTTAAQLDTICSTGLAAMKTGMLPTVEMIELAAQKIDQYQIANVVIDPVMVCKGTDEVLLPENTVAMRELLLPRASIVTPNAFEAWQLAGTDPIHTVYDMKRAAENIYRFGAKNVYIKGGSKLTDSQTEAVDLFYDGVTFKLFHCEKFETKYTHGAGCTTAAAITAGLANDLSPFDAALQAKQFVSAAIRHGWKLNQFVGPVMHGAVRTFGSEAISVQEIV